MTKAEFETILDRLFPPNRAMRDAAGLFLPRRIDAAVSYLFLHEDVGSEEDRAAVRHQLQHLDTHGVTDFTG